VSVLPLIVLAEFWREITTVTQFEVSTTGKVQVELFWLVTLRNVVVGY